MARKGQRVLHNLAAHIRYSNRTSILFPLLNSERVAMQEE